MEIISYVGFNSRPSFSRKKRSGLFPVKRNSITYKSQNIFAKQKKLSGHSLPQKKKFSLPTVRLSTKIFRVHLWFFLTILFSVATVFAAKHVFFYSERHTEPVVFQNLEEASEIDILNGIMSQFALDFTEDFNDMNLAAEGNEAIILEPLFKTSVSFQDYTVKKGDTISGITKKFNLSNLSTLIGINNISSATGLKVGQKLRIPSIDGLMHKVQDGNSLMSISEKYNVSVTDLLDVNDLQSQVLFVGQELFIPGARLSNDQLSQALGTYFANPLPKIYRITSLFGMRTDPIAGYRSNHTGIDLACAKGTPVKATQAGTVAVVSYSNVFGNYIIINHGSGYQSLYAHLSKTSVTRGQRVAQGTLIGNVGSTGYSTGDHLHFTVYKNGSLVNPQSLIKF